MNNKILGRMEAILDLIEKQGERIREDSQASAAVTGQLNRALTILHEFSDKIDPLFDWIKDHERVEWITTNELAAELKVTRQTIWNWYRSGVITGYQFDPYHEIRFDRKEVTAEIKSKGLNEGRNSETA